MSNPSPLLCGRVQKGARKPGHLRRVAEARGALAEHSGWALTRRHSQAAMRRLCRPFSAPTDRRVTWINIQQHRIAYALWHERT